MGQEHLTGEGKLLKTLLNRLDIPSMILWGPPGCGKVCIFHKINLLKLTKEKYDFGSFFYKVSN